MTASLIAADSDVWRFQAHPEVWLIVACAIGFGYWVANVLAPKAAPAGEPAVTRRQTGCFIAGLALLWVASDWPMHDISEEYLYSAHMVQHFIITMLVPPLLLLAVPEWLARLIVSSDGTAGVWIRRLSHPVAAAVLFNGLTAVTHLTQVVNTSARVGAFHYGVHLLIFSSAMLLWVPVFGPMPELRISYPARMVYLFTNSLLPTVPGGFLTFSNGALYEVYDHAVRVGGLSVTDDQQIAGLIMKIVGGFYLWSIIGYLFFKWVRNERVAWRPDPGATSSYQRSKVDELGGERELTFERVKSEFTKSESEAPIEHPRL